MSLELRPGWYRLAPADALGPGQTSTLELLGEELLLYRDAAGRPRLMEPWCPHLGAHLGHGGRVEGELLVCAFHGWRIHADGHVAEIPYSDRAPPKVCLRTWLVTEWAGQLLARVGKPEAEVLPKLEGTGSFELLSTEQLDTPELPALAHRLLSAPEVVHQGPGLLLVRGELAGQTTELLLMSTPVDPTRSELSLAFRPGPSARGLLGDWASRRRIRAAAQSLQPR